MDQSSNVLNIIVETPEIIQSCPCCDSSINVIRKGSRKEIRKVRHLDCFENKTILYVPSLRLYCTSCDHLFVHIYSFVEGKSRYTDAFKDKLYAAHKGSTVKHVATLFDLPYSTCEIIIKERLNKKVPEDQEKAIKQAEETKDLVLGVDDFSIKKGHTYNTGVHDLKNETLLLVTFGRKYSELSKREAVQELAARLNPKAVVMDLAQSYHRLISELFPNAIRIADRFHVNRYITDAFVSGKLNTSDNDSF